MLRAKTEIRSVSTSGGLIIQSYGCQLHDAQGLIFECDTVFGFFSKGALSNQVGLRDADWKQIEQPSDAIPFPQISPMPDDTFRMVDSLTHLTLTGGRHGFG